MTAFVWWSKYWIFYMVIFGRVLIFYKYRLGIASSKLIHVNVKKGLELIAV